MPTTTQTTSTTRFHEARRQLQALAAGSGRQAAAARAGLAALEGEPTETELLALAGAVRRDLDALKASGRQPTHDRMQLARAMGCTTYAPAITTDSSGARLTLGVAESLRSWPGNPSPAPAPSNALPPAAARVPERSPARLPPEAKAELDRQMGIDDGGPMIEATPTRLTLRQQ